MRALVEPGRLSAWIALPVISLNEGRLAARALLC
jgi:hypothetical protein